MLSILVLPLLSSLFVLSGGQSCSTTSGSPCIFPFGYGGVTFNDCTDVGADVYWCPTTLINDQADQWGECNSSCPRTPRDTSKCLTMKGFECKFPFIFGGVEYNTCTMSKDERKWCAVTTFKDNNAAVYGYCDFNTTCQ